MPEFDVYWYSSSSVEASWFRIPAPASFVGETSAYSVVRASIPARSSAVTLSPPAAFTSTAGAAGCTYPGA